MSMKVSRAGSSSEQLSLTIILIQYLLSYIDVRSGTAATPAQDARASPFALQGGPPLGSGLRAQPQELKQLLTEAQEGIVS